MGQRGSVGEVVRRLGATQVTYYRWRREYDRTEVEQAKRLEDLESEASNAIRPREMAKNARLKRLLADAEFDKAILKEEAPSGTRRAA